MSLEQNLKNLTTRVGTECKALRTMVNGNLADLSSLATTQKSSLVGALNELKDTIDAISQNGAAVINDSATSTASTWSSQKTATHVSTQINSALAALVSGAPGALDTINELATALGNDANFAASVASSIASRVRFDEAQALTEGQKAMACANIGVGNPDADFVSTFNGALL